MPKPIPYRPRIPAGIGLGVAVAVTQHVGVRRGRRCA